ncbi:hypothetical protein LOTGIDRAFT_204579 [Lottia gigantea]|uniref:RCC1-like G exchanging factor-like protein n=1 Tax=Lottia gigantea TaxID=225164 RepID=V4BAT8_LOTGI|nr:hypothetical protein LOTGIDRAFT_204579 [Lottia gigantea]ESO86089.1 hypothetical protein LOTGIDRAFT_204579 [Lottia gigantea]
MSLKLYTSALTQLRKLLSLSERISGREYASGWKKRTLKREKIKETVIRYVGVNAVRTQRVYLWGCSATGALGIQQFLRPNRLQKPKLKVPYPTRLKYMNEYDFEIYDIACGYGFSIFAVKKSKQHYLLATGINTDSQIGFHEEPKNSGRLLDYVIAPLPISLPLNEPELTQFKSIACGRAHTVILTQDNTVYSLGNNSYGQCGRGIVQDEVYSKSSRVNVLTDLPDNIVKVECGSDHTLFLTKTGEVYSCGLGADGQTGLGMYNNQGTPLKLEGDIQKEKIVSVASKGDCVLAVSKKGEVFGWGNSEYNQLSMVTEETQVNVPRHLPIAKDCGRIIQVAAGGSICAVLNEHGEVYVWGYGILGKGLQVDMSLMPTKIPQALFGESELLPNIKVTNIICGLNHFVALTDKGDVYTWGKDKDGSLGLGECKNQFFPLRVALPAEAKSIYCGVDHTVTLCRSFC